MHIEAFKRIVGLGYRKWLQVIDIKQWQVGILHKKGNNNGKMFGKLQCTIEPSHTWADPPPCREYLNISELVKFAKFFTTKVSCYMVYNMYA